MHGEPSRSLRVLSAYDLLGSSNRTATTFVLTISSLLHPEPLGPVEHLWCRCHGDASDRGVTARAESSPRAEHTEALATSRGSVGVLGRLWPGSAR